MAALCVLSDSLHTTCAVCGALVSYSQLWLCHTDKECCSSRDHLPYYHRGQAPVNMTTLLLGMLCCTSTAVAR